MKLLARAKPGLIRLYERFGESLRLDRLEAALARPPRPVNRPLGVDSIEGDVPPVRFIVATSAAGLLLFEGARCVRLFNGYPRTQDGSGGFYGITRRGERWYVYQAIFATGRIISFGLEDSQAVDARVELKGLPRAVHQIDFIEGELWIVDTFHNRVLVVPEGSLGADWRRDVRVLEPNGPGDILEGNISHFNSIFGRDGLVYLVAHNETHKTQRPSELYVLDRGGSVLDRLDLTGGCCHNVAPLDGEWVTCWSWEGGVGRGGRELVHLDGFTRGLSIGADYHIVGASGVATRDRRDQSRSRIVVTDTGFEPVATLYLDRTQIHEIRRVDAEDLGFSPREP